MTQQEMRFDGATYEPKLDLDRLSSQLLKVEALMLDGKWRTLTHISIAVKAPESSVSARLRDLRKPRFGSHLIDRRRVTRGLFEYRMVNEL